MDSLTIKFDVPLQFTYTNYKGNTSERRARFDLLSFGTNTYHLVPQWMLVGWDYDRGAQRTFALSGIDPATIRDIEIVPSAPPTVKVSPTFTMPIIAALNRVRHDLPKTFSWSPTVDQEARATVNHDGLSLDRLKQRGGVSWSELAAILSLRPVSNMRETQAVAYCVTKYPQEGFTL